MTAAKESNALDLSERLKEVATLWWYIYKGAAKELEIVGHRVKQQPHGIYMDE